MTFLGRFCDFFSFFFLFIEEISYFYKRKISNTHYFSITVNNKEFIAELSRRSENSSRDVADMIFSLTQIMIDKWQNSDSIAIQNFGAFEVRKKTERVSVNPVSKQRLLVPPKLVLTFRPSNMLKDKFK